MPVFPQNKAGTPMSITRYLHETLTLILAGGQGERLYPLTKDRAKPAVPFAGEYRIIDFTLSNCVNSGLKRIYVLTQYMSHSLDRHLQLGWNIFSPALDEFLYTIPPQFRSGNRWYMGTADAVFQNIHILQNERPAHVVILSGDHVYRMDYSEMIETHARTGALATAAVVEYNRTEANRMGVVEVDSENRILSFEEKPADPKTVPGNPDMCLVNMGVYIFETATLVQAVSEDARRDTAHDFGKNILPSMLRTGRVFAYPFRTPECRANYWRDIGTIDAYYEASMDQVRVEPAFNLYDHEFPILTFMEPRPPVKMVFSGESGRMGMALDSLLCSGCIVSGGRVERSILSPNVRINSYSSVQESILFDRVSIGRHANVRRAIIDKDVKIPQGMHIGYDREEDARRFTVTDSGVVVIPKGIVIE
jgi:glucose-1-phosphate adenylyltransferase